MEQPTGEVTSEANAASEASHKKGRYVCGESSNLTMTEFKPTNATLSAFVSLIARRTCPATEDLQVKAGISGYIKLEENNAADVMAALATVGPLAVNVDASNWHNYESGVYDGCSYEEMDIDHVVVLVGYGVDEETKTPYWLIRNSWSPTFGEAGYIRLLREAPEDTKCGVDTSPQDGTGCDGAATQYPCGQCGVVFDVSYPTGAFLA